MNQKQKAIALIYSVMAIALTGNLAGCDSDSQPVDAKSVIVGRIWKVSSRVENGGAPSLPLCASDDTLELRPEGTFNSLIAGTQCNPNEIDVIGGKYSFSADNSLITFTTPGFEYTGKVIEAGIDQITIEFNLGPGFVIKDTFKPKS
jgi:hypothetical protein